MTPAGRDWPPSRPPVYSSPMTSPASPPPTSPSEEDPARLPALRRATASDIPGLAALWALAFPGERTVAEREAALHEGGPWGGVEDCWLAESAPSGSAPRIDGAFRALPLILHLFGRPVPTLGVAAVAVAPHARRQGLGSGLCRGALRIGRERGDLLAALYPFRTDFYARLGFALAGELHRYRFPAEAIPPFPGMERVSVLADPLSVLPSLHDAFLPSSHGLVVRSRKRWEALLEQAPLAVGIRAADSAADWAGYLLASVRKLPRGQGLELRVTEFLASDPDTYRAGLGWISAQRDAWRFVTLDALPGERLYQVLAHPHLPGTSTTRSLWFPSATVLRGPMVRILDPGGLLERLGADAGTRLSVDDPEFPENRGTWQVDDEGSTPTRVSELPAPDALPVALASSLLVEGQLPGLRLPRPGFEPPLGITDFRLLDPF
jgi:predicted acetyltransferase